MNPYYTKKEFIPMEGNFHFGLGPKLVLALILALFYMAFGSQLLSSLFL